MIPCEFFLRVMYSDTVFAEYSRRGELIEIPTHGGKLSDFNHAVRYRVLSETVYDLQTGILRVCLDCRMPPGELHALLTSAKSKNQWQVLHKNGFKYADGQLKEPCPPDDQIDARIEQGFYG